MNKKANQLINEKSPYLLQHAYNPVDWYPWGNDAFEKAESKNCLIFLSIGYSTCHWCHQMAHDAFSDVESAKYLNNNYVSIKVDREERPDIDEIYMLACQFLSDNCGWPLNIILTPDKKPIFAATYMPSKESFGIRSLLSILKEINKIWQIEPSKILNTGNLVLEKLKSIEQDAVKENIYISTFEKAFEIFSKNFDSEYGGFGVAPKFPTAHSLIFLMEWYKKSNEKYALEMVEKTLKAMYEGGIFDHIGGGFHRYSTDNKWLLPHFEKMLYDQALIAKAYIKAYQITKNEIYANVAKKTLDFAINEMTNKEGAFYSGLDADIEGEEGKFYMWTADEIFTILGSDAELFCIYYGVTEIGNLEIGKNVLYISESLEKFSKKNNLNFDETVMKFDICLKKLYEKRNKRVRPHIDDKIIASWNGLMINTLAFAGKVFEEEKYTNAAIMAANFLKENLITPEGDVFRSYREEKSNIQGFIEDYSFLSYGLLKLYQTTLEARFLEIARKITEKMIAEFYDEQNGGFFLTSTKAETPLVRMKYAPDHALPSGNSIAVLVLLMLKDITKNSDYAEFANKTFNCVGQSVNLYPTSYSQLLTALMYSLK